MTEILTVSEVAALLRCSKAHVHNIINGKVSGTAPLPSLMLGRRRLVRRESLLRWMHDTEGAMIRASPTADAVDA